MSSLVLILDEAERRLPEQDPHYLWMDAGILKVSSNPPSHDACVGYFVSEFGAWWFHSGPSECPPELRINGRPVDEDVELATDRAEVALSAQPYSEPAPAPGRQQSRPADDGAPPPAGRQYVIGPLDSDAQWKLDDPSVVDDHARVEIDDQGGWWITAHNGDVYVDDEPVTSAKLAPGAKYRVGHRTLVVPNTGRRGRGLPVECAELSVRRGPDKVLDNVSLAIPSGDFAVVYAREPAGATMLLGLVAGVYRADHGTVRIGESSRRGGPAVRWVPETDDLHGLLTVRETLAGVDADRREELLSWVGLAGDAGRQVRALDDGERKRLAIARELAERPAVLVVFEAPVRSRFSVSEDRDLMSRLATISQDTGCTILMAARMRNNLDHARTVVVLDRSGRLRYAGPAGQRADYLAALDVPADEPEPGRNENAVRLPAMRPRPGQVTGLDGLRSTVRQQATLFRARGNGLHVALAALALVGSVLVFASFGLAPFELAVVAVLVAIVAGGADLVTARLVLARERRSGIGTPAMVTGRLIVHGGVCALLALPLAVAATLDGADLPDPPGLPTWFSYYVALLLTMLFALSAALVATAAAPADETSMRVLVTAAIGGVAAVLLSWFLLAASWPVSLPVLLVLVVAGTVAAAMTLESRLS